MGTFTISLSGTGVVNGSKSWTVSDADVTMLATYLVARYSGAGPQMTQQQALATWAQDFVNHTIADVTAYQKSTATVTPIGFS